MLMPKRTKYRRVQRGRMKGAASRGNKIAYGEFGIQAMEPGWITGNQIEAARVAMTRYTKRGGQVWIKISKTCGFAIASIFSIASLIISFSSLRISNQIQDGCYFLFFAHHIQLTWHVRYHFHRRDLSQFISGDIK